MTKSRLQTMRDERLEKIRQLEEIGINPYPSFNRGRFLNKFIIRIFHLEC